MSGKNQIDEVKASGEDSEVMDPIATGSNKRKLDKSGSDKADKVDDKVNKEGGDQIEGSGAKKAPARKADKTSMKEAIESMFEGEDFSEEFKERAAAIFEAVVIERVNEEVAALEEANEESLAASIAEAKEELEENVNKYLDFVTTEWMEKNELAIESGIKSEVTESFLQGMKTLFAEHYVDIPEDKVDIAEALSEKVVEQENVINEMIKKNLELKEQIEASKAKEILESHLEGLTESQKDRLMTLAEDLEFTTEEKYSTKIATIKEAYFKVENKKESTTGNDLNEEVDVITENTVVISPEMEKYVSAASRILKK